MNKRTKLKKARMPRWIWQLRLKGFHVQLKKYLKFLWRQRPDGCNWSRVVRARYFDRTISTITRWDAFLEKWHLVWVSSKGTMDHRIGARPYYARDVWLDKCGLRSRPHRRRTNAPPYTAQQKKYKNTSSSAAAAVERLRRRQLQADAAPGRAAGVSSPQTPAGSVVQGGAGAEDCSTGRETRGSGDSAERQRLRDKLHWKLAYNDSLHEMLKLPWSRERAEKYARKKANNELRKIKAAREP